MHGTLLNYLSPALPDLPQILDWRRYLIRATKTVRLVSVVMTVFVHAKLRKYVILGGNWRTVDYVIF